MPQPGPGDKVPLTLYLPLDLARRLQQMAESQKRPAAEVAIDILDRILPQQKTATKIPYT